MKLIKVKDGLIEVENFFLTSNFSDFAGSSNVTRDISTGKLKLVSNNKIERRFEYNEFVIELEKENFNDIDEHDYSMIYLGNVDYTFGIRDGFKTEQNKFWKILRQDNYIQAYASSDGINYKNIGGMKFDEAITKQGFEKYSKEDFILNNYKVYASPYVTIQNFDEGTICELYDKEGNLLKTREFNSDLECKVFLNSNNIEGYFLFKNAEGNLIYSTDVINLQYGDVWVLSPYNFEIIYNGSVVTNVNAALLQDLEETITIKNIDTKNYTSIAIGTETSSNDLIELSLDNETYTDTIFIDNFLANEEKTIYVKITKNAENHNFCVRDFQLVINQ